MSFGFLKQTVVIKSNDAIAPSVRNQRSQYLTAQTDSSQRQTRHANVLTQRCRESMPCKAVTALLQAEYRVASGHAAMEASTSPFVIDLGSPLCVRTPAITRRCMRTCCISLPEPTTKHRSSREVIAGSWLLLESARVVTGVPWYK